MSSPDEPPEGERPPDPQQVPAYPDAPSGQAWPYQQQQEGVRAGPLIGGLAIGLVVGFVASVVMTLVGAGLSDSLHVTNDAFFLLPQLLPLALSVFLLAFRRTRVAGAGLVMGVAIGAILMPGMCLALFGSGGLGG